MIYYITQTYVTLYSFITDDFPKFVVAALLFTPFNDWTMSLVLNIITLSYFLRSDALKIMIYFFFQPVNLMIRLINEALISFNAFNRNDAV